MTIGATQGTFELIMSLYTDATYANAAGDDYAVNVPDNIYIGLGLMESDGFILQAKNCWITPSNDPQDSIRYEIISDACPNSAVNIYY